MPIIMTVFESQAEATHAPYVRIPCIVFFAVTPIFLFIRVYNRISRRTGLGWDDVTIILSYASPYCLVLSFAPLTDSQLCTLTVMIFMMVSVDAGFGQHIKTLSKPNKIKALQVNLFTFPSLLFWECIR